MEVKNTIYDILGYILPGALLVLLVVFGWAQCHGNLSSDYSNMLNSFWGKIKELGWGQKVLIIGLFYLLGHLVSSVSSLFIGDWIVDDEKLLDRNLFTQYENKLEKDYHCAPNHKTFRLCVCHVEAKQPEVYSTAFAFLSFYGMARNTCFLLLGFTIWEVYILTAAFLYGQQDAIYFPTKLAGTAFVALIVVFYTYYRFLKYYRQHIIYGFLLKEKADGNEGEK